MAESILIRLARINMLNIIILAIVAVWVFGSVSSIIWKQEMTESAQNTLNGLKDIMLMVLGYYLKSKVEPLTQNKETE